VPRLLSISLVLLLLAGTAAAFAVTEGLKLEKSPLSETKVDKLFSPTCGCPTRVAHISFRVRKADHLTVEIVRDSRVIRTLMSDRPVPRGPLELTWNGYSDEALRVADGLYQPQVHFADAHRTILLPNLISVDTQPPTIEPTSVAPRVLSPDGDKRADVLTVAYRVSQPARALLYVNGHERVEKKFTKLSDRLRWYGVVGGQAVAAGVYRLSLVARDRAGNVSKPLALGVVRVRYIALAKRVYRVKARTRFAVRVETDARRVEWRLGARTGSGRPRLVLRAPARRGRYALVVQANGNFARGAVIVRKKK
jgi:hypothetical protein